MIFHSAGNIISWSGITDFIHSLTPIFFSDISSVYYVSMKALTIFDEEMLVASNLHFIDVSRAKKRSFLVLSYDFYCVGVFIN